MIDTPTTPTNVVHRRLLRALMIVGVLLGTLATLYMLGGVVERVHTTLVDIIFGVLFAYVVYPPIKFVARYRIPVPIAGLIVYLAIGGLLALAIASLAPAVYAQSQDLARNYPHLLATAQQSVKDPQHAPLLAHLPAGIRNAIADNAGKLGTIAGATAGVFGSHAFELVTGTGAFIANTALSLGLALIFISDLAQIQEFAIRLVPRAARRGAIDFMIDVDKVVGGFARGQVFMAFVVAAAGTIVLLLFRVPYAILLGLLAGLISIIPLVGAFLALVPVALITYVTTLNPFTTIVVLVLFLIITQVQQQVLIPLVVAKSVGVTPLVVFLALLLGSEAFGVLGALLSIPIAGILRVAGERLFPHDPSAEHSFAAARAKTNEPEVATEKALAASPPAGP